MAREYAIPSTSTFIQDFGLNVTPQPVLKNRRVVVIGTAEDGPMYEPVLVDKPDDSEIVWGRYTQGELVRGILNAGMAVCDDIGCQIGLVAVGRCFEKVGIFKFTLFAQLPVFLCTRFQCLFGEAGVITRRLDSGAT